MLRSIPDKLHRNLKENNIKISIKFSKWTIEYSQKNFKCTKEPKANFFTLDFIRTCLWHKLFKLFAKSTHFLLNFLQSISPIYLYFSIFSFSFDRSGNFGTFQYIIIFGCILCVHDANHVGLSSLCSPIRIGMLFLRKPSHSKEVHPFQGVCVAEICSSPASCWESLKIW